MKVPLICSLLLPLIASRVDAGTEIEVDKARTSSVPRSVFDPTKIPRDPFERIDAKYLAERSSIVAVAEGSLDELFRVTALSVDRLSIAVINGKAFAEKESFLVRTKEKEIRTTLLKISETGVELDCGGTLVKVPMIREKPALEEEAVVAPD